MTERVIVALVGVSRFGPYLAPPLIPEILLCDVCRTASRPLFYVASAKKFVCSECSVPLPA